MSRLLVCLGLSLVMLSSAYGLQLPTLQQILSRLTASQWNDIQRKSAGQVLTEQNKDKMLFKMGVDKKMLMTANDQHRRLQYPKPRALDLMWEGEKLAFTSIQVRNVLKLNGPDFYQMSKIPLSVIQQQMQNKKRDCLMQTVRCGFRERRSRYRTADGRCNNLKNPLWGRSFTPFTRVVRPAYNDEVDEPRLFSVNGQQLSLPSARLVSRVFHANSDDNSHLDSGTTHMVMQFGQFLDHDHSHAPIIQGTNEAGENTGIDCCMETIPVGITPERFEELKKQRRKACFPIIIPAGDKAFKKRCMNFVRSVATPLLDCQVGPREQVNQLTAYVDGSQIYGSTKAEEEEIRQHLQGLLKTTDVKGFTRKFLPQQDPLDGGCIIPANRTDVHCTLAGDERVNEHNGLTSMHTMWMREHNRLAADLSRRHQWWGDNKLFKEARRINSAQLQHILYNEFLPIVIGPDAVKRWNLAPKQYSFFNGYDPTVNAQMGGSFSTAAYRFGHSMIRDMFVRKDVTKTSMPQSKILLRNMFNRPQHIFENGGPDSFLSGLINSKAQTCDRLISKEISEHLFEDANGDALDLISLNIQRGRDHGIPAYNVLRKYCNLTTASGFLNMPDISSTNSAKLAEVYSHVDDIDLFTGGLAEKPVRGGVVGPTFACLMGEQHHRLKVGDRFFYENRQTGWPTMTRGFTFRQLKDIRCATLAGIICKNTDVKRIQPKVFQPVGPGNQLVDCQTIPKVNTFLF